MNVNLGLYLILKLMNKAADIRIFNQNMYDAYLQDLMDRVSNVDRVLNIFLFSFITCELCDNHVDIRTLVLGLIADRKFNL